MNGKLYSLRAAKLFFFFPPSTPPPPLPPLSPVPDRFVEQHGHRHRETRFIAAFRRLRFVSCPFPSFWLFNRPLFVANRGWKSFEDNGGCIYNVPTDLEVSCNSARWMKVERRGDDWIKITTTSMTLTSCCVNLNSYIARHARDASEKYFTRICLFFFSPNWLFTAIFL